MIHKYSNDTCNFIEHSFRREYVQVSREILQEKLQKNIFLLHQSIHGKDDILIK